MKKLLLLTALFVSTSAFNDSSAQIRFGLNINIGIPTWIPGGPNQADYYYMPEIDAYYCIPQRQFIYMDEGNWVFSNGLPSWCNNYDLYRGYKVAIYEPRPYLHADRYREKYAREYRSDYAYHQYRQPTQRAVAMDNRYVMNNQGYDRRGREEFRQERENRYDGYNKGRHEEHNNDKNWREGNWRMERH